MLRKLVQTIKAWLPGWLYVTGGAAAFVAANYGKQQSVADYVVFWAGWYANTAIMWKAYLSNSAARFEPTKLIALPLDPPKP